MSQGYTFYPRQGNRKKPLFWNLSVNITLVLTNIVFFILALIFIFINLIGWEEIAISPKNIFAGQYLWTFLTSIFMHGSFLHLFANMLSLVFIGGLVERILGPKRYLNFYLASGLFAGVFYVLISKFVFVSDFATMAVGASGALFGLVGFLMLITPDLPVMIFFIPIPIKMKYAAPGILIALWLISIAGGVAIGNTAHLGGLLAGLFYGFYIRKKYPNKVKFISRRFS